MKNNNTKRALIEKLSTIMPVNEAEAEIDFTLRELYKITKKDLLIYPEKIEKYSSELEKIINERIKERKPLQYIINKATFYNEIYYVDENVLIPRPETEILVQEIIKQSNAHTSILDIGTGSGCIAITLASILKNDNITTCDISEKAINIAKKNAINICPQRKINFVQSDIFRNINDKYDIIVSNPPYISCKLKSEMSPEVLEHEPHLALFAKDDGLYFYKEIITKSSQYLFKGGMIFLEIGINQEADIVQILENNSFSDIKVIPDLNNIPRIIEAKHIS